MRSTARTLLLLVESKETETKVEVGYCSRNKAFNILKDFHLEFISKYIAKVIKNKMPLIKPKYRDREIKLKELLHEFHDLTFEDQMSKLEFYCTEFSLYTTVIKNYLALAKSPNQVFRKFQKVNLLHVKV